MRFVVQDWDLDELDNLRGISDGLDKLIDFVFEAATPIAGSGVLRWEVNLERPGSLETVGPDGSGPTPRGIPQPT